MFVQIRPGTAGFPCIFNSLILYLSGLWVFQLLGFVQVQKQVPEQTFSLAQFV